MHIPLLHAAPWASCFCPLLQKYPIPSPTKVCTMQDLIVDFLEISAGEVL